MKSGLGCLALLMVGFTTVACTDNPPIPCLDGTDVICDKAERLPPLGGVDLVCNEGYTLEMACQDLVGGLPPQAHADICANLEFDLNSGTCQPPGETGFPCAEDLDCASEICTDGSCE